MTEYEQRQIAEAIARAERRTDAELVTVLARRADDYPYLPLIWAALLALAIPLLLHRWQGGIGLNGLMLAQMLTSLPCVCCCATRGLPPGWCRRSCAGGAPRAWPASSFSSSTCSARPAPLAC